jgi:hypothetical protein
MMDNCNWMMESKQHPGVIGVIRAQDDSAQ